MKKILVSLTLLLSFSLASAAIAGTADPYYYWSDDYQRLESSLLYTENAHYNGSIWVCNSGYWRVDNYCYTIEVPGNAHKDPSGVTWSCNSGYTKTRNYCKQNYMPTNAHMDASGVNWVCNPGYSMVDNNCKITNIPANAHAVDSTSMGWACDFGYTREGSYCAQVKVPSNAHLDSTGLYWACNSGYTRNGDYCSADRDRYYNRDCDRNYYNIPTNAYANGSSWTCGWGYKRVDNYCQKINVPANAHLDSSGVWWNCDSGYRLNGWSCVQTDTTNNNSTTTGIPANAHVMNKIGIPWACNIGYLKSGNSCEKASASDYDRSVRIACDQDHKRPEDSKFCMLYNKIY